MPSRFVTSSFLPAFPLERRFPANEPLSRRTTFTGSPVKVLPRGEAVTIKVKTADRALVTNGTAWAWAWKSDLEAVK